MSPDRLSHSLSGGELQRVHLARSLASSLTDTLICLDEPTVGLHAKDISALVVIIKDLVKKQKQLFFLNKPILKLPISMVLKVILN